MESVERKWWIKWGAAALVAVAASVLAARWNYFPGDVAVARFVQAVLPADSAWAQAITKTAGAPGIYWVVALTVLLSWWLAGWRAALLAVVSFVGLWLLGPWMQKVIGRPRPAADLIRVVGSPGGFSFPSISALNYAATFGYLAALTYRRAGAPSRLVFAISVLALILCAAARVVLGAHWPSDVLGAYLIGFVWTALLVQFARR